MAQSKFSFVFIQSCSLSFIGYIGLTFEFSYILAGAINLLKLFLNTVCEGANERSNPRILIPLPAMRL